MKTLPLSPVPQPRFVWAVGAYTEAFPDMPQTLGEDGSLVLWDRQERKPVATVAPEYAALLCLERTDKPNGAPLTALESWLNGLTASALASEGIAS
jgi:hypothetical protein